MRFLSKHPRYRTMPIGDLTEPLANGSYRTLKQGVTAEFRQEPLEPWEEQIARESFAFTGTTFEEDEITPVDPITRVSVWDTDQEAERYGWTPELKAEIEHNMLHADLYGSHFIRVERPPLKRPWPSYDEFTSASKIAAFVVEAGLDPLDAIAYERQNAARADVLAALEALEAPEVVTA